MKVRTLRFEVDVVDNGGVKDYDSILVAFSDMNAEVVSEREVDGG